MSRVTEYNFYRENVLERTLRKIMPDTNRLFEEIPPESIVNKRKKQSVRSSGPKKVKRNQAEVEKSAADYSNRSTLIVEVNNDCLERVFDFLEFQELINVAEANTHFQTAARIVFARKLKQRIVLVDIGDTYIAPQEREMTHPGIVIYPNAICIRSPLLALKTIRLFCTTIPKISLKLPDDVSLRQKFFVHVNQYCYKTLKVLHISGDHSVMTPIFSAAKYPFKSVEQLTYDGATAGPGHEHLTRLFPHLSQITLNNIAVVNSQYLFQTFPNLDSVTLCSSIIDRSCFDGRKYFIDNDLETIMNLHPQLQSFGLVGYGNMRIWSLINAKLKHLKHVCASFAPEDKWSKKSKIVFENVETLEVRLDLHSSRARPVHIFSFKRLRKLVLKDCISHFELGLWMDFVLAHPSIEELVILNVNTKCLRHVNTKLNEVCQITKSVSYQMNSNTFKGCGDFEKNLKDLPTFLENHQWFTAFSVKLYFFNLAKVEMFYENIPPIKNYKIQKKYQFNEHFQNNEVILEFEKC